MAIVVCPKCGTKNRVDERSKALQPVCGKCGEKLPPPVESSNKPVAVTDATFASVVLSAPGVVLVDCWAAWCGPCRMIAPIMDQLAAESAGRYTVAKLDVDQNPRTAAGYQISSIPAMLIFKGGKVVDQFVGLMPKDAILNRMQKYL